MAVELGPDGAWCWFQDPRAVRHVGTHDRTYTGWITAAGDVAVARYDHETGEAARTTLHADFERDDHDAPTFHVDDAGRLLVFYTAHNGPAVHVRRGERPESVASFGPDRTVAPSTEHTYPDPRAIGDDLSLFYRNAAGSVACVTSPDGGDSWSAERELVTTDGREWCVYRKVSAVRDGAVDLGLTYAAGGGHDPHRDVRHLRFDGEELLTADGASLGRQVTLWDAPAVYDSEETGHDAWVWDCSVAGGAPELVYAELRAEDDHAYRYAAYDGGAWRDVPLAEAGSHAVDDDWETYYSGGVALDHENPGVCYYSAGDREESALYRAETPDGGASWARTELAAGEQNLRPVVPRNRHPDLSVLWLRGDYGHYRGEYETAVVGE